MNLASRREESKVAVRGADGEDLGASFQTTLDIFFGQHKVSQRFVVIPSLACDMLLGINFILPTVMDLFPARGYAKLGIFEKEIPLYIGRHQYRRQQPLKPVPLRFAGPDFTLKPRHQVVLQVGAEDPMEDTDGAVLMLPIGRTAVGLTVAEGIVHLANGETKVIVTNLSDRGVHIKAGTVLAEFFKAKQHEQVSRPGLCLLTLDPDLMYHETMLNSCAGGNELCDSPWLPPKAKGNWLEPTVFMTPEESPEIRECLTRPETAPKTPEHSSEDIHPCLDDTSETTPQPEAERTLPDSKSPEDAQQSADSTGRECKGLENPNVDDFPPPKVTLPEQVVEEVTVEQLRQKFQDYRDKAEKEIPVINRVGFNLSGSLTEQQQNDVLALLGSSMMFSSIAWNSYARPSSLR